VEKIQQGQKRGIEEKRVMKSEYYMLRNNAVCIEVYPLLHWNCCDHFRLSRRSRILQHCGRYLWSYTASIPEDRRHTVICHLRQNLTFHNKFI